MPPKSNSSLDMTGSGMDANVNSLSPATYYFIEYWEDLWSGVSSKRDLLTSFNPRVVIKELFDEITFNKQGNKANEDFFRRTLNEYLKSDPGSQKRLKLHLQMMLKEFDLFRHRPLYLPQLCNAALKIFDEFAYFEDCVTSLIDLTSQPNFSVSEKEGVQRIANHLIVEFREIGYTDDEIRNFPREIFSSVQYNSEGFPYWNFPHSVVCEDWTDEDWSDKAKLEEYGKKLEALQSNLSEKDRLQALLTLARKKKRSIRFIFRVNGMTGTEELEVGQVLFYPPLKKRLVMVGSRVDPDSKDELFKMREGENAVNASVVIDSVSAASGETVARSKVEKAFALCRRVMHGESPLWISKSYLALNEQGEICAASHSTFERSSDDWTKLFTINTEQMVRLRKSLPAIEETRSVAISNGWGRRFHEACSWLRKAEESNSYVEKLLSYWICIETLCAKSEDEALNWFEAKGGQGESDIFLIKEVVGKMRAVGKCYQHGWSVYHHLAFLTSRGPFPSQRKIQIPAELAGRAQLTAKEGEMVLLRNFINCCGEIEKVLPDGVLKDQVTELHGFYNDKQIALKVLKSHLRTTQDELAFIYRMRNKIAHDGSSEHPLLPSLCKLAEDYAVSLFNQVGLYVVERKEAVLDSILITAVQDYDRIEMRLQVEEPINVLLEQN